MLQFVFVNLSIMIVFATAVLSILAIVYFYVQHRYKFWNERGFVSAPTSFLFGNLKGLGTKIPSFVGFDRLYKSYKGKVKALGMYLFISPTLMIIDIDLVKNVFIRDFSSFHDRGFYYNKEDDPLSANMVSENLRTL